MWSSLIDLLSSRKVGTSLTRKATSVEQNRLSRLPRKASVARRNSWRPISIAIVAGLLLAGAVVGLAVQSARASGSNPPHPHIGLHTGNNDTGQYWSKSDAAFTTARTAQTNSKPAYIGQSVAMPNGLELKVTQVQRNWQPTALVSATYGRNHDGDDSTGREIILVWFTATDVGTAPIGYNDSMFTLLCPGKHEQRVAVLSSLLSSAYGDDGVEPWLLPGQSKTTFVPFLVNIGEAVTSFQYYIPPQFIPNATQQTSVPPLVRLSIQLSQLSVLPTQSQTPATSAVIAFVADTTITVGP